MKYEIEIALTYDNTTEEKTFNLNDYFEFMTVVKSFEIAFGVTVYKYQGATIHDHYNIYNTDATNSKRHIQFCYYYEPYGGKCLYC